MPTVIAIEDHLDVLPFHAVLTWERFQTLCTDILYKQYNAADTREYLAKGSKQQGIDLYSVAHGEEKVTVAQCKLVDYLGPKQVLGIIDDFLRGDMVGDTKQFVLCTSASLSRQKDEEETIAKARQKLFPYGIDLIVWDEGGLTKELRNNPTAEMVNIVYHYFGEEVALSFYGDIWKEYLKKLQPVKKKLYDRPVDYIEREIISYKDQLKNKDDDPWNLLKKDKATIINLLEKQAENQNKIVLLSIAGFGKTEELKNIAGYFSMEGKLFYPVKFSLRDYEGQTIEDILLSYNPDWRNIREEYLLLLFDGLDEASDYRKQTFINHLNAFVESNPKAQVVISSRYNSYEPQHPQLRGFEIYILKKLTHSDIHHYLLEKLETEKEEFIELLRERNFYEYISNPYYLTRLVRFYKEKEITFPNNKVELFERILFEQLEKDEGTYHIPDLKEKLLPVARQIAFCMTLAGKSALTDAEMQALIPDQDTKRLLNHFSVLNRNAEAMGSWSFEHKNLQEYLCASALTSYPFKQVKEIISFQNGNKLLPAFLNTVSFLFELLEKSSPLFHDLSQWMNTNEPELLIRFEKEQLSKPTRTEIFKRIFNYYKDKGITIRVSTNFSYEELARFTDIENDVIDFLSKEIANGINPELIYDTLSILSYCKKPYLYKDKLIAILLDVITHKNNPVYDKAKAIVTFTYLELTDQALFEKIINSGIDLTDPEIRQACISFLNHGVFFETYSDFILKSIVILEEWQKKRNMAGSFTVLKELILKFKDPKKVKEIFQYCLVDRSCLRRHDFHKEFQFELSEVKELLGKAIAVYQQDKSILPIIYRLYCGMESLSVDNEWFKPFKSFFEKTCGTTTIFMHFYKHDKRTRDIMSFADAECCDFLIAEYKAGKVSVSDMIVFRNVLSHVNFNLFEAFYEKLKELGTPAFIVEDMNVDYNQIRLQQEEKNQLMLLDRELFVEEANTIFALIKNEKFGTEALWFSENIELRKYQSSLVLKTIRDTCLHTTGKVITKKEILQHYQADKMWDGFVIDTVYDMLKNKREVHPELLVKVTAWCKHQIKVLDFENSIKDQDDTYTVNRKIEFVKEVFCLLEPDLDDSLLLKMLPSDHESFNGWNDDANRKTVASVVTEGVTNKELLKNTVVTNIKKGKLAIPVLLSHFTICHKLHYKECLRELYEAALSLHRPHYTRIKLAEYYLGLGGEIIDFTSHLKVPPVTPNEQQLSSWEWFLIDRLQFIEPAIVTGLLLEVLNDPRQTFNKIIAAEYLIRQSRIEGLEYWEEYVKKNRVLPFEHKWSNLHPYIPGMPSVKAIDIFLSVLTFVYENNMQDQFSGSFFIEESIYSSLIMIAKKDQRYYDLIQNKIDEMINLFSKRAFVDSIRFYSERLKQRYYETKKREISILNANLIYQKFSGLFMTSATSL